MELYLAYDAPISDEKTATIYSNVVLGFVLNFGYQQVRDTYPDANSNEKDWNKNLELYVNFS